MAKADRPSTSSDRRPSSLRRRLIVLAVLLGIGWGAYAYFTSSTYLVARAKVVLKGLSGANVHIESADFELRGRVTLNDVRFTVDGMVSAEASELFRASRVTLTFDWATALFGRLDPTAISLGEPVVSLTEDLDRRTSNFEMLKIAPAGETETERLPSMWFSEGRFRYGVVEKGEYRLKGQAALTGQLVPDVRQRGRYQLALRRTDDVKSESEETAELVGTFDLPNRTAAFRLQGLKFTDDYRRLLPVSVREQWAQFEPGGTLPEVSFRYSPSDGWYTQVELDDVGLTLPQLGTDESRFRMTNVKGSLIFAAQRIEVKELVGRIEDLVYQIDGQIDGYRADAPMRLTLRTTEFDIPEQPRYIFALPAPVQEVFRMLTPVGRLRVSMALWRTAEDDALDYTGQATIIGGTGYYHRFKYPLTKCRGLVVFNREAVEVKSLTGDTPGGGTVTISGSVKPPGPDAGIDLVVTAVDLPLDQALYDAFDDTRKEALDLFFHKPAYNALLKLGHYQPADQHAKLQLEAETYRNQLLMLDDDEQAQRLRLEILLSGLEQKLAVQPFSLGGRANVVVNLKRPPGLEERFEITVDLTLNQASCTFRFFPYPVRVTGGRLQVNADAVTFSDVQLEGLNGGTGVLDGEVLLPKGNQRTEPKLRLKARKLPVDALLHDVLDEVLKGPQIAWLEKLNAAGTIDVDGRIFADKNGKADIDLAIDLAGATARPGSPGYALSDLSGQLGISLKRMLIQSVRARQGVSQIELNGSADWADPKAPTIRLQAAARDMQFQDRVLDLLAPFNDVTFLRKLWKDRQPEGLFDADIDFTYTTGGKPDYTLTVHPESLEVNHNGQRVRLTKASGTVIAEPNLVTLKKLGGKLGTALVSASGKVTHSSDVEAQLLINAKGDQITDDLKQVLPKPLLDVLKRVKMGGAYEIELSNVDLLPDAKTGRSAYVQGTVALRDGELNVGVPVSHLTGEFKLKAEQRVGQAWPHVAIDANVQQMQVLDRKIRDFKALAHSSPDGKQVVIPVMKGHCAEGTVGGSGRLGLDDKAYQFRLALSDVSLSELVVDRPKKDVQPDQADNQQNMAETKPMKGLVSASLDVQGVWDKPGKLRGRGDVQIREAEMYELPLSLGVLQLTHLQLPVSRNFNKAMMSYYVRKDEVTFERLLIESPNMRLSGGGTLNTGTQSLDLTLTSSNPQGLELGPITELIKGFRDQIITVRVTGTLDKPDAKIKQFTGITRAWHDVWGTEPPPPTED